VLWCRKVGADDVGDWIVAVFDRMGVLGVGLLVALENLIPPIPSEVILPLAGFRARTGAMNPYGAWLLATAGAVAGALILYALGAWLGYERLHRLAGRPWFVLTSQSDLAKGNDIFCRHGSWIVAAGRCIPVVRSLVSLPAGISGMPLGRFVALTAIGSGLWNAAFIWAGWALAENWSSVDRYLHPVGLAVTVLVVVGMVVLAVRRIRARTRSREREDAML
jgi:membrane protein DedA with SNARE-associated domain